MVALGETGPGLAGHWGTTLGGSTMLLAGSGACASAVSGGICLVGGMIGAAAIGLLGFYLYRRNSTFGSSALTWPEQLSSQE